MAFDTKTSNSKAEEDNQRRIDREIKDMVSTLTHRLTELQSKSKQVLGDSSHTDEDDKHGIRVVTLAGSNTGASMRADLGEMLDGHGVDHEMLGAYTNSNYQAVNNSIMMDGSYTAEDPGVHVYISDYVEEHGHGMEELAKMKEKMKKKKGYSKSTKETASDNDDEKKSDVDAAN